MKTPTLKSAPLIASEATKSEQPVTLPASDAITDDFIKSRIFTIRSVQVMLSSDLASLYDVEVKHLHRQVKRNEKRFPPDFVMHISPSEAIALRCQNVTSKRGGDRYGTELYHFGASLKDLGRQYCAVTKMDAMFIPSIMQRI